jgi:hypothetical protein
MVYYNELYVTKDNVIIIVIRQSNVSVIVILIAKHMRVKMRVKVS